MGLSKNILVSPGTKDGMTIHVDRPMCLNIRPHHRRDARGLACFVEEHANR